MRRDKALDFESLVHRLQRLSDAAGWQFSARPQVTSTNELVRAMMANGANEAPACVALASMQTAGVGRRGTHWLSGAGDGLWFSLVVPAEAQLKGPPPTLALAGCLAAVLEQRGVPVEVKWPNDLYLAGGKLGGLMLERGRLGGRLSWLAGVGINWRLPPGHTTGDYHPAALEMVPDGAWRRDPVGLAADLVDAGVRLLQSPSRWPEEIERLRRCHHWYGVPVEVCPEGEMRYVGVGGEIRRDGWLEVRSHAGCLKVIGPNDRVRAVRWPSLKTNNVKEV
ncbi:MAG TPA: biotin--[acetyl-CoA-carboxylase] ligase [Guyparkeria sp.]|nr:biotin--[acetyl-CoA-carboxylase] ligase [Guyparkeria sp.]